MYRSNVLTRIAPLLLLILSTTGSSAAAPVKTDDGRHRFENKDLTVIIGSRTSEQLAAFYTGRGFDQTSINAITKTCFIFGIVKNSTYDVLWLTLDDWEFLAADGTEMKRWKKPDWKAVWKETGLSQAHQSTFGWTQLPEQRDLRRHEGVGGNIAVEWKDKPFKLVATFKTGSDKAGTPVTITVENLTCNPE